MKEKRGSFVKSESSRIDTLESHDWWINSSPCKKKAKVELFYPRQGSDTKEPLKICGKCVFSELCLDYAVAVEDHSNWDRHGVWGGTPAQVRKFMGWVSVDKADTIFILWRKGWLDSKMFIKASKVSWTNILVSKNDSAHS